MAQYTQLLMFKFKQANILILKILNSTGDLLVTHPHRCRYNKIFRTH